MKPITELTAEHGPIRLMLRVLEKICAQIEKGEVVADEHLRQAVIFIREFADQCHHGKEENLLFPAMRENNIPEEIPLIDVLIEEHKTGRNFARGMAEAIKAKDSARFSENARGYISLLDQHIDKENKILFPMADRSLSEEKQKILEEGFEDVEKNVIGEGRHEELHKIIHELKEIYL
jgi:hemerythrin-like domain-containing protein